MQYQQFIVITGGVGVGKSTLISNLKNNIPEDDLIFIKEYIDHKPEQGKKMLEETLKGRGSMYDLQLFILDCFNEQLQKAQNKKYVIFERSPYDSIFIFSTEAYHNGRMSEKEYFSLHEKVDSLYTKYHIPKFDQCAFWKVDSCQFGIQPLFNHVKGKIEEFRKIHKSACFLLYCSDPVKQKDNIERRGRPEEKDYDINYMMRINNEYEKMFSKYF